MLEKIKPYLDDLRKEYEIYSKKKKWFRENKDTLTAFEKDIEMRNKVREMIEIYDTSHIFLKLWIRISMFWSIPYYKNLLQYYDLNVLLQKMYSDAFGEEDKMRFLEEMITFLDGFDVKIKEKILFSMQQELLKVEPVCEKNADTKVPAVPVEAQSAVDLLEDLHGALDVHMKNCDVHLATLNTYLPQQKREVDLLISEVDAQSQAISVLQKDGIKQDESLLCLSKEMEEQSVKLNALCKERNRQSLVLQKQSEDMRQFDEKVRLLIIEQMKEWIGGSGGKGGQQLTNHHDVHMHASPKMTFFQA